MTVPEMSWHGMRRVGEDGWRGHESSCGVMAAAWMRIRVSVGEGRGVWKEGMRTRNAGVVGEV